MRGKGIVMHSSINLWLSVTMMKKRTMKGRLRMKKNKARKKSRNLDKEPLQ